MALLYIMQLKEVLKTMSSYFFLMEVCHTLSISAQCSFQYLFTTTSILGKFFFFPRKYNGWFWHNLQQILWSWMMIVRVLLMLLEQKVIAMLFVQSRFAYLVTLFKFQCISVDSVVSRWLLKLMFQELFVESYMFVLGLVAGILWTRIFGTIGSSTGLKESVSTLFPYSGI